MQGFNKNLKAKVVLIGVVVMGMILSGCTPKNEIASSTRTVKVLTVGGQSVNATEGVSGNIVPIEMAKVSFKIDGVIESIPVKEGDVIKKGDIIAKIKPKDYELALKASKAQFDSAQMTINKDIPNKLSQAKAQLDLTQLTYDRVKALYEQGSVSKSDFDQVTTKLAVDKSTYQQALDAYEIANMQLGQAKAAYEHSADNVNETTIYSPMDGIVLKKLSAEGEVQGAGYPVAVVGVLSEVWAEFGVTDGQIGQFKVGQKWPVYIYGIEKEMEGIVSEIGAVADEKTRQFTIRLKLNNENGAMKPGMIAKANFTKAKGEKILLPLISVVHLTSGDFVYVYDVEKKTVTAKKVKTGNLIDDRIEVLNGVALGDKVVIEGQYQISDGEQVTVND